jgi:hypothetical protein
MLLSGKRSRFVSDNDLSFIHSRSQAKSRFIVCLVRFHLRSKGVLPAAAAAAG